MLSDQHGEHISDVEVTNISSHGFWLLIDGREYFLAFDHFPWFKDASISTISHIERQGDSGLHWPELDVDLSLAIIENPDKYPLSAKI